MAKQLFHKARGQFINEKNRPDIVVLPGKVTLQLVGIEAFDPADPSIVQLQQVLLIELKKGGFKLTRKEVNQADGYVQDIAASGAISGAPFVSAWVVGQSIAAGVANDKKVGDDNRQYGRVRATTFGALIDTANRRMMKLRDTLEARYARIPTNTLIERVLERPDQAKLKVS